MTNVTTVISVETPTKTRRIRCCRQMALLCLLTTTACDSGMVQATVFGQAPAPTVVALGPSYIPDDVMALRSHLGHSRHPILVTADSDRNTPEAVPSFAETADGPFMNAGGKQSFEPFGKSNIETSSSRGNGFASIVGNTMVDHATSSDSSSRNHESSPPPVPSSNTSSPTASAPQATNPQSPLIKSSQNSPGTQTSSTGESTNKSELIPASQPLDSSVSSSSGNDQRTGAAKGSASTLTATDSVGSRLVDIAKHLVGIPYVWGGADPSGFDCSGLTQYVAAQAGLAIPRTSWSQDSVGQAVSSKSIKPGDLVFFSTDASGASHVGIYVGDQEFIHADAHRGVTVAELTRPYWKAAYIGARRLTPDLHP